MQISHSSHAPQERGIDLHEGVEITSVSEGHLNRADGSAIAFDECLWCTSAAAAPWVRKSGLPTDDDGFLAVDDFLQAEGGPGNVFGAGDIASSRKHPRPKAGVYAVRAVRQPSEGHVLLRVFRRCRTGGTPCVAKLGVSCVESLLCICSTSATVAFSSGRTLTLLLLCRARPWPRTCSGSSQGSRSSHTSPSQPTWPSSPRETSALRGLSACWGNLMEWDSEQTRLSAINLLLCW